MWLIANSLCLSMRKSNPSRFVRKKSKCSLLRIDSNVLEEKRSVKCSVAGIVLDRELTFKDLMKPVYKSIPKNKVFTLFVKKN